MAGPLLIAMVGIGLAGTALDIYGTYQSSKAQAEALRRQALLDRQRAEEVLERNKINNDLLFGRATQMMATQQVSFAGSGRALSATTLAVMANTMDLAAEQAIRNNREAQWEAMMINLGADSSDIAAMRVRKAAKLNALGQAFVGALNIYSAMPGEKKARLKESALGQGIGTPRFRPGIDVSQREVLTTGLE